LEVFTGSPIDRSVLPTINTFSKDVKLVRIPIHMFGTGSMGEPL